MYAQNGFALPTTTYTRPPLYWTVRFDGEDLQDLECASAEDAYDWAREQIIDQCIGEYDRYVQGLELVQFYLSPVTGAKHIQRTEKRVFEYEKGRSDYDEHSVWWQTPAISR